MIQLPPNIPPSVDDSSTNMAAALDSSKIKTPGHQGDENSGGVKVGYKVVFCSNMPISVDYELVYLLVKQYGKISKIRLVLDNSKSSYNCYVVYENEKEARKAKEHLHNHSVNGNTLKAETYHINNLRDDPYDFIPRQSPDTEIIERKSEIPRWFVASYKKDEENLVKGIEYLRDKIGGLPDNNIKRYGRAILIKAGNETQSCLLYNFKTSEESNIDKISPHKSFNNAKGMVYSRELYEFTEEEILKRCPKNVLSIQKLKGINHAILVTFASPHLPEYIKVSSISFTVKKFLLRPTQCHKCFDYGHVVKYCGNNTRCYICSGIHDMTENCTKDKYCFHCKGPHSPNWRQCPIYKFNQDILNLAENEHISVGAARRQLRRHPSAPMQTFASTLKKTSNKIPNKAPPTTPSHSTANSEIGRDVPVRNSYEVLTQDDEVPPNLEVEMEEEIDMARKKRLRDQNSPPKVNENSTASKKRILKLNRQTPSESELLDDITPSPVYQSRYLNIMKNAKEKRESKVCECQQCSLKDAVPEVGYHHGRCGCHNCFLKECKETKPLTKDKLINVIRNFFSRKDSGESLIPLELHTKDCMCIKHLHYYRVNKISYLDNFLENQSSSDSPNESSIDTEVSKT